MVSLEPLLKRKWVTVLSANEIGKTEKSPSDCSKQILGGLSYSGFREGANTADE